MATGTWEDFTDKYGFSDGEGVEQRDFEARARLVEMLNDHEAMKAAGLHALEYDRPGLHNPCLVVVVKGQAKAAKELLKLWLAGAVFFLYAPLEGGLHTWSSTYLQNVGHSERKAGQLIAGFWSCFLLGRLAMAYFQHWRNFPLPMPTASLPDTTSSVRRMWRRPINSG